MKTRGIVAAIAAGILALTLASCGSSDSAIPNLKGTWTGTYEFPTNDKTIEKSSLTIEITKQ